MNWSGGPQAAMVARDQLEEERRVLRSRLNLADLPRFIRAVTERVICATADLSYATDLACLEPALDAAARAVAAGAPVIVDGPVVAAGITDVPVICKLGEPLTKRLARSAGIELAAAAVRLAYGEAGPGAIWVIGHEPAAIYEILTRQTQPALVVGLPAGLVGAVQAKRALRESQLPSLTNVSEKGGPVVAAASCLALVHEARMEQAGCGKAGDR